MRNEERTMGTSGIIVTLSLHHSVTRSPHNSSGPEVMGKGELVRAGGIGKVFLHRPGDELVMKGNQRGVVRDDRGRLARERFSFLFVDSGERLLDQLVELGVLVASPVPGAVAFPGVGAGDQRAQREVAREGAPA